MLEQALKAAISNKYVSNKIEELTKQKVLDRSTNALSHAEKLSKLQEEGPAIWEKLIKSEDTKEEITIELFEAYKKFGNGVEVAIRNIVDEQWRDLPNKSLMKDPILGLIID